MLKNGKSFLLLLFAAACQSPQTTLSDRVCQLTQSTEQLTAEGVVLSTTRQQIAYNAQGLPVQYNHQLAGRDSSFVIEYKGTTAVRAVSVHNPANQLIFQYNASNQLAKVAYMLGNNERGGCSLEYEGGSLSRILEVWKPGTAGAPYQQRSFRFQPNEDQNVQIQRVTLTASNGSATEEEWQFTFDQTGRRSPYADVGPATLLAVLSLTNPADPYPCRFLQRTGLSGYQRYSFRSGQRILREAATVEPEFDAFQNPIKITTDLTGNTAGPRKLQQTFQYLCIE